MLRSNQHPSGGGGEAASRAVGVACGSGSLFASTDAGEVFSWGQGGQGELGQGGASKAVVTPGRLPWARDAGSLAASCGGRFATLVDSHGRLFTWGAGKAGALGHGDTSKRAVGRPVKALASVAVRGVACGAEWMLVLASWRPPAGRGGRGSSSGSPRAAAPGAASPPGDAPTAGKPSGGFRYAEVEAEPPSPRSPRQRRGLEASGALSPGCGPSTPLAGWQRSDTADVDAGFAPASSSSGRLRRRSGREQRQEWEGGGQVLGRSARRRAGGLQLPDVAPEAVLSRWQRWMAAPPLMPSPITPPDSPGGSDDEGSGRHQQRHDARVTYLLRRQLKVRVRGSCRRCRLACVCEGASRPSTLAPLLVLLPALHTHRHSAATRASAS